MWKVRITAFLLLLGGAGVGYFIYHGQVDSTARFPFKLGLDLSGGSHLVYQADVTALPADQVDDSMESLRDVIERRINLFGVSEPLVQVEETSALISGQKEHRLIVELPGVTDIDAAIRVIGQTPTLEFKTERPKAETEPILEAYKKAQEEAAAGKEVTPNPLLSEDIYEPTQLTGRFLERAQLVFDQTTGAPVVSLIFNDEGAKLFAEITKENVGKTVAIYLDGAPISTPVVQEEITGGKAQITGNMTPEEAKELVGRLNSGALPVPITLLSTETIGPTLGEKVLVAGVSAGMWGLMLVAAFLILWYRLPGLLATVALGMYVVIMLALFKLIPVTLTAAGIAGFILSIGMAVDANILIFERMKEEMRKGKEIADAIREGFARAWNSIRDSNISSIISAIILFWFGTSLIKGFALTLFIGVLVSMISAISVTRTLLLAFETKNAEGRTRRFLFGSGIR